ncbi:cation-translocating P-type ATPase [Youngiibacter fragilis]|uniref:ATPase n=1 Tax=Youngiibacter fragilis 232.1 TaxID=994573 RepID=V7I3W7_9CLOT|nr:cation-translocating P-type ATPase [Youngiibacter fragilis]ETA80563.1 ATPase [Youngiibacter fragilis 232.1]
MKEYYNKSVDEVLQELKVGENGLADLQVDNMRMQFGENKLKEVKKPSPIMVFVSQFNDFLIWILLVAAAMSAFLGKYESTLVIAVVVIINASLGTVQHLKAEESLQALKALSSPKSKVIRNGATVVVASEDVVVGDLIIVETGDFVSADGRIIKSFSLKVDESALTGESVSVEKDTVTINASKLSPGDQCNMIFSGTHITYGRGVAVVTCVGGNTEIGKIATLLERAKDKETPLQKNLDDFGKKLAAIIIVIAALIFALNLYRGKPIIDVFMFSVSLAVAAIPEALSSIVTIVLAIGTRRMAKENAIIRKLYAVEGLGSVSIICSDKTGTLTQNKMSVKQIYTRSQLFKEDNLDIKQEHDFRLLMMSMLCNDAITTESQELGDPTEIALVNLGELYGWDELRVRENYRRISELPFDSNRKLMSTLHDIHEKRLMVTKGALDAILQRAQFIDDERGIRAITPEDRANLERINTELGQKGLRILAFSYKEFNGEQLGLDDENKLVFIGLIAMMDPPRAESAEAVANCYRAGIRTVMITGDHIITASAIAKEIGIMDNTTEAIEGYKIESMTDKELLDIVPKVSVYARVSPEHKIRIVRAWQELGHAVAMTGDGVNDAPALKQADIGIAMGITGTEVSKDAASMILTDDNFATIVKAISNGRSIYGNIMNSVKFLLSGNTAGILAVLYASIVNLPAPFAPVHLLFINLLTDSFPAIAIGIESPKASLMNEKPRDIKESILTRPFAIEVLLQGLLIATVTMMAFHIGMQASEAVAVTMAFAVLCLSRLIHGFNCRSKGPLTAETLFSNRYIWIAFITGFLLLTIVLTWDPFKGIFEVAKLTGQQYLVVLIFSFIPLVCIQLVKRIRSAYNKALV